MFLIWHCDEIMEQGLARQYLIGIAMGLEARG